MTAKKSVLFAAKLLSDTPGVKEGDSIAVLSRSRRSGLVDEGQRNNEILTVAISALLAGMEFAMLKDTPPDEVLVLHQCRVGW